MAASNRRQQAAVEYLIVYGIAILIIILTGFYLYTIFQNPSSKIPNTCTFSAGFSCTDIVIGSNAMTGNTAILVVLSNSGDSYIQAPSAKASIRGINTSSTPCIPSYVKAGGSVICLINLTNTKSSAGQSISGTIYVSEQNCAFSTGFSCKSPANQIYVGKFEGTATYTSTTPKFQISISTTQPSARKRYAVTAYLSLFGVAIEGATINFSSPNPNAILSSKYVSTNQSGQATTFVSGSTSGVFQIYANFSNTISSSGTAALGVIAQVPITLVNSQSSVTGSNFQQMISFNPSQTAYSANEASDLGNIRFYQGGTELYSWCEGGCTSSSSNALFWVKLPSGIGASGANIIINMTFLPKTAEYDGAYAGEAPGLSASYGKLDNGQNVFTQYGGGGTNGWNSFTLVGGTWTTANGFLQQTSSGGGQENGPSALIESTSYSNTGNYVTAAAFNYIGGTNPRVGLEAVQGTSCSSYCSSTDSAGYRFIFGDTGAISFLNDVKAWAQQNSGGTSSGTSYTLSITDAGGYWSGKLYNSYNELGSPSMTLGSISYTAVTQGGATTGWVGLSAAENGGSNGNPTDFQWFYMRALPPAGVMPTQSFGTIVP